MLKTAQQCQIRFHWRRNDFYYTRSLIAELSLASGAEYEVILLMQLNGDENANFTTADLENEDIIYELKEKYVPGESRDILELPLKCTTRLNAPP
jgi:hypothetical protein